MTRYALKVNGQAQSVTTDADTPLLYALRDDLALKGPKFGCGLAQCGACTVMVGGEALRSCSVPVSAVAGRGGFTGSAYKSRVLVVRGSLNNPQTFVVDTAAILAGKAPDFMTRVAYLAQPPTAT